MTNEELMDECKTGLNIPLTSTVFDNVLRQKLLAVKGYMKGAGVSDTVLVGDLAVGVIVMGVTDIWNIQGGEIRFSPAFHTLLGQLVIGSSLLGVSGDPAEGATGVPVSVLPRLTFTKRITGYTVSLVNHSTLVVIPTSASLDVTGKVLTIIPSENLDSGTKYAAVIHLAKAFDGPELGYTVISFNTI